MDYIHSTPRDWDMIELRWIGAPGTDPAAIVYCNAIGRVSGLPHAVESNRGGRFLSWLGRLSRGTKRHLAAANAAIRRKTISARQGELSSLPAGRQTARRRRSALGLIRRLRDHCTKQLASRGYRRHNVIARVGACFFAGTACPGIGGRGCGHELAYAQRPPGRIHLRL